VKKITLSVSKVYKNTGKNRFHRENTKKHWKHYFLEEIEEGAWGFNSEWVNSIKAQFLKPKIRHKRLSICLNCKELFYAYVKNDKEEVFCPYCPDDEELELVEED